jgi:membrane-associated phospholipid phosphatase
LFSPATTAVGAAALLLAIVYAVALGCARLSRHLAHGLIHRMRDPERWPAREWQRLEQRWAGVHAWIGARFALRSFTGLPLLVFVIAVGWFASTFAELAEEIAESEEVVAADKAISAAMQPYRTDTLVTTFKGITTLGDGEVVFLFGVILSVYFWVGQRRRLILPLWITVWGAQLTTWLGKRVFDRARPEFVVNVFETSASFPSGHATGAMALFGFAAYALSRHMTGWRARFEMLFWSGALILLVGFSRVFLSVHYASDVAGGFLVGSIWLLAGIALTEWREERMRQQRED